MHGKGLRGEEGHFLSELAHILSRENLDRIFVLISRAVDASCAVRTLALIPIAASEQLGLSIFFA